MQDVEAAVRNDKFFARSAKSLAPRRQFVPGDDLVAEIHAAIFVQPPALGNDLPP